MAGGPILPASIYLGGASGSLYPAFYVPATNTVANQGAIEGVGVVASLGSTVTAVLQFNLPEVIPSGTLKLRTLFWANATTGNALTTTSDGQTAPGASMGTATLNTETQVTYSSTQADRTYENKQALTTVPTANSIMSVLVTFNSTGGWTLAQAGVFQYSLVWE